VRSDIPPEKPTEQTDTSRKESSDDYSRVVVMLDPRWRVIECRDGIQWIIQRREKSRGEGHWRGVRYCTTRKALKRDAGALVSPLSPSAVAVLNALPDRISRGAKKNPAPVRGCGVERPSNTRGSLNSSEPVFSQEQR